jgi:excisionase family DNA binding protein
MTGMTWMTTAEVAERIRASARTVNRAAADGRLHSHQPMQNGKRVVAEPVIDAWVRGASEAAQRELCGCMRLLQKSA